MHFIILLAKNIMINFGKSGGSGSGSDGGGSGSGWKISASTSLVLTKALPVAFFIEVNKFEQSVPNILISKVFSFYS